jgi:hypothetical protein
MCGKAMATWYTIEPRAPIRANVKYILNILLSTRQAALVVMQFELITINAEGVG